MHPVLLAFLILSPAIFILPTTSAQPLSSTLTQQKISQACSFLEGLYNPSLGLVKSTNSSSDYYSSDNILAAAALSSCSSSTSKAINQTILSCCTGYDDIHQAVLGNRLTGTPPFPTYTNTVLANSTQGKLFRNVSPKTAGGNYTVFLQVHSGGVIPDCVYADVVAYSLLELRLAGNTTGVGHEMECLALMFDGRGLVDEPFKDGSASEHGIYQTFKLALYLTALQASGSSYYYGQEDSLLRMQGPDGGFHTGYDQQGTYAGTLENAETTSFAIIALSKLSNAIPFLPFFPSIPLWVIVLYAGAVAASIGSVLLILYLDKRKLRRLPPIPGTHEP